MLDPCSGALTQAETLSIQPHIQVVIGTSRMAVSLTDHYQIQQAHQPLRTTKTRTVGIGFHDCEDRLPLVRVSPCSGNAADDENEAIACFWIIPNLRSDTVASASLLIILSGNYTFNVLHIIPRAMVSSEVKELMNSSRKHASTLRKKLFARQPPLCRLRPAYQRNSSDLDSPSSRPDCRDRLLKVLVNHHQHCWRAYSV